MTRNVAILSFLLLPFLHSAQARCQVTWQVEPGPSSVDFRVPHLIFSQVEGRFEAFSGQAVMTGDDFSTARVTGRIDAASIYTGHRDRDRELRSEDFFWTARYPEIVFESRSIQPDGDHTFKLVGDLTMRGKRGTVELRAEISDPRPITGNRLRVDVAAAGTLNRMDYDLKWNALVEAGQAVVGDEVEILLMIALTTAQPTE